MQDLWSFHSKLYRVLLQYEEGTPIRTSELSLSDLLIILFHDIYYLKKSSRAHRRGDGAMRLVRRITVIKFRECSHTVLAYIFEESLNEVFCPAVECVAHHPEAEVDVRSEEVREGAALVVSQVAVDL